MFKIWRGRAKVKLMVARSGDYQSARGVPLGHRLVARSISRPDCSNIGDMGRFSLRDEAANWASRSSKRAQNFASATVVSLLT